MATRQELTKLLKSLNKADLVKIVLELTRRNKEAQDKIMLEYGNKESDMSTIDINFIKDQLNKVDNKVFTESWMRISSSVVGKYCRESNKIINTYIEPLIKHKHYFQAFELLQEVFYYAFDALGYAIYRYDSSNSFFNKLEKDLNTILNQAKGTELYNISKSLYDNLDKDPEDAFFAFNMRTLAEDFFESEKWEQEKEQILINEIDDFLKDFDKTKPAPETLSKCALDLINLKINHNSPEEEVKELIEKYDYLGDIARLKAENYLREGDLTEAKECLRKANSLPTMSEQQKYQNSNYLIRILSYEDRNSPELKEEVKHNLDTYVQESPVNLLIYFSLTNDSEFEKAYKHFESYPTTKNLYLKDDNFIKMFSEGVLALNKEEYQKLDDYSSDMLFMFLHYYPKKFVQYATTRIKELMKDGPTEKNYRVVDKLLQLLYHDPQNREVFNNLKQELISTYPSRGKLEHLFTRTVEDNNN